MQHDDLPAHIEADAGSTNGWMPFRLVFESEELVEDPCPERGGNAGSRIANADGDSVICQALRFDRDNAPAGRVLERIRQDIVEDGSQP